MAEHFPLKLVARRMLAPTVAHLAFLRDDGQALDFIPGQYVRIHLRAADGSELRRSYSLATVHDHALGPGEAVELAVSYIPGGTATVLFEHLAPGDRIEASGPYGDFRLEPEDRNRRYLLVASGTGVTPFRSMLPELERLMAERGLEVVLLLGARSPEELLYGDEFRAFAERHPGFRFVPCLSRELPAPGSLHAHPDVREGYVQTHLAEFAPDPVHDIAYLCGNPAMVDAAVQILAGFGLPDTHIRHEKYVRGT